MLAGHNHTVQTDWLAIFIFHRYLCLSIRQDPFNKMAPPAGSQFPDNPVRQHHGHRQKLRCLITGISDHNALIPGSVLPSCLIRRKAAAFLPGTVYCFCNVRTLLMDQCIHLDVICRIPHIRKYLFHNLKHIRLMGTGDLPGCQKHSFCCKHLAGYP